MMDDEIAVVGIGCHFPGGEGLENFWRVLLHGENCAVQIPDDRFNLSQWYNPDESKAGKTHTAKAALIDGLNEFDNKFFGITDSELISMDPQHKLLLQCTYRALEDAGIPMEKASGTKTGVFLGLMNRDFELASVRINPKHINHTAGTGALMSIAANRISYVFNFTGPSLSIDCACSSSLVALHLACQAIKQGDCEMALFGGVSCILEPLVFVALSKAKMISPDGTSKPFSSKADGYGRGEGCGIVLLKPLKKALEDHDHIWGTISKTAVNQDGHSVRPITKPSMVQQEELLRKIYSKETDLTSVQYIEAHGTGTPIGDPVEAGSISKVIAKARPQKSGPLIIGSVKGNIGHTESAAGVAGLIKVLLMMQHETIVPSLFYSLEDSSIDVKSLNIKIPTTAEKWISDCISGRSAGINNFGFGGTNAHAIVRQYVQSKKPKAQLIRKSHQYFVVSAASEKSMKMIFEKMAEQISAGKISDLQSLLYTSACRRSHLKHKYRKVIQTSSLADLQEKLTAAVEKKHVPSKTDSKLVFVFCGNGVTYQGMCKQLLKQEPVFREEIMKIETLLLSYRSLNLTEMLESESEKGTEPSDPKIVQPLLFAIQVAVVKLLKHWGISPDAVLGHSVGEVAAAHCSGLLSLEDAVKVIHYRSSLQSTVTGGKMLVVSNMAVSEVLKILPSYSGRVCLAAYNSPQSCTLSGDADDIERLQQSLSNSASGKDLFLRILDVPAAYHSHKMDPILSKVEQSIGSLQAHNLETELFSTVTGVSLCSSDFLTGEYWAKNIREPVEFEQAVKSAAKNKRSVIFVEIGPRRSLQRYITETLGNDFTVIPSVQPDKDHETMLALVSELFELGVKVDWEMFYKGFEPEPVPYPRYQFDDVKTDVFTSRLQLFSPTGNHPVVTQMGIDSSVFSCDLASESVAFLQDHKHNGVAIIPGAFYAELGLATCMAYAKPKVPLSSLQLSITFQSPFVFTQNAPDIKVQLDPSDHLADNTCNFKIHSTSAVYAFGTVEAKPGRSPEEQFISVDRISKRCTFHMMSEELYKHLSQTGFEYGSVFRNNADIYCGEEYREAISVVKVPKELLPELHDYHLHPVVMDYFMQIVPVTIGYDQSARPQFPAQIRSLTVFEPLQEEMVVYLRAVYVGEDYFDICGCLANKQGRVLVELMDVKIRMLGSRSQVVEEYFYHNNFSVISEVARFDTPIKALVFSDQVGISEALQQYLDPTSRYVSSSNSNTLLEGRVEYFLSKLKISSVNFQEILFMWGDADLTSLESEKVLDSMAGLCEIFRKIVGYLKALNFPGDIRVITYKSSETIVEHINPGFVLSGMTRACAAELPELSFQLIDMGSATFDDIKALVQVLRSYPCNKYPELVVKEGKILHPEITHTPLPTLAISSRNIHMLQNEDFILQTSDPYAMKNLSASKMDNHTVLIQGKNIELHLSKICVHSSDYFPVSISALNFGQTLYWNKHTNENHKLLALDFSGTVTAVGKDVRKFKVGDHVVSCYPVAATSKVVLPADVCCKAERLSFLNDAPCVSFMVLAWEILHKALPKAKQQRKLGIFSTVPDSALMKVLIAIANRSGWNVSVSTQADQLSCDFSEVVGAVLLPPYNVETVEIASSVRGIKDIVFVCDNQVDFPLNSTTFSTNEEIYFHVLFMSQIMQKWSLQTQMPQIYRWLKSLDLDRKPLSLDTKAVQKVKSQNIDLMSVKESESYFRCQMLPIILLNSEAKKQLSDIPVLPKHSLFQENAVYIVTGGLTGLGFETVKFIAQRGGGNIVLLSRSNPNPQMQQEISQVSSHWGSVIKSLPCDVSVSEQVDQTIVNIGKLFPSSPIKGVFHSAVVLHDGLIERLDKSLYEKVMRPKVNGVINLHRATIQCSLDYFVCYSSISAFIGNASQTNYAAANTFMDTFCQYRRNIGLSGQSINWGALNLGLLLNKVHFQKFLEAKGIMLLEIPEIHESLEQCLLINKPQQVVCRFNFKNSWNNILSQNKSLSVRLFKIAQEAISKAGVFISRNEQPMTSSSPRDSLRFMISETTGVEMDELNDDVHLFDLGIDSMLAMTLQNLIFKNRGVNVPLVTLLDPNSTLATVIKVLEVNCVEYQRENESNSTYL
ncbi:hybrid PKS-NRPS synthetase pytA-like [Pimephales promelas]|uniref:hybrid PKS-NRPS synthetase pytA-like n=1 Tax=Pimephales promelas TaxID=90988 RepID=UPI001955E79C|nr:hybrid PKS-NRPS synthetase pytA-like [Pimephales promelas]KAG1927984.1 type I polyketide synthase [Pimephales promelas]